MKTRVITLGYYEDLEAEKLHYILKAEGKNDDWEKWFDFFVGDSFLIDGIEITVKESKTKTGQRILTLNYEIENKSFCNPLFHNFTGRFALTKGALINGLIHYNKPLSRLQKCLVNNGISIRCIRNVDSEMELNLIYSNINADEISELFMAYLRNNKIQPRKLMPKTYKHSVILPVTREAFEAMKEKGFLLIEKQIIEDGKQRIVPSMIFLTKKSDKTYLIDYINRRCKQQKEE